MAGETLQQAGKALQGCGCSLGCIGMIMLGVGGLILLALVLAAGA